MEQQIISATEDYSQLLETYGIPYSVSGYHLLVGNIEGQQGWIVHLSVIRSQLHDLLKAILPLLASSGVAFKIPADKDTARMILDGSLGFAQVGKVVTIYPENDHTAIELAAAILARTIAFTGPSVLTDAPLGGILSARYGAFNGIASVNADGQRVISICLPDGSIKEDVYTIPFLLDECIPWPFGEIADFQPPAPAKRTLKDCYRLMKTLKSDPKGNVYKALRVNKWYLLGWSVIKEAKYAMWSDDLARDMQSRLRWQYELHKRFEGKLPIPKAYDFFVEDRNAYLVMKHIAGKSLYQTILSSNPNAVTWQSRSLSRQLEVLDYLLQLIHILQLLHTDGYVHRDVTPMNFIVHPNGKIYLIDIELAYCLRDRWPSPAFVMGTKGFMSPQQEAVFVPSTKEDIYALGATCLNVLTGLSPLSFDLQDYSELRTQIGFFIVNDSFSQTICNMLAEDPESRPDINSVKDAMLAFRQTIKEKANFKPNLRREIEQTGSFINRALNGLSAPPTVIAGDLWYSIARSGSTENGADGCTFEKKAGLAEGVSGALYLLGKAAENGFNTRGAMQLYRKGWAYLGGGDPENIPAIGPGLYAGSYGLALALKHGLTGKLLGDTIENRQALMDWLTTPHEGLDLASGAAGRGVALLQCKDLVDVQEAKNALNACINTILEAPLYHGSWVAKPRKDQSAFSTSFSYGDTGILWFSLQYLANHQLPVLEGKIAAALQVITKAIPHLLSQLRRKGFRNFLAGDPVILDGLSGLVLTFLKAYETMQHPKFLQSAERILVNIPPYPVHDNFNQNLGLSHWGEVYLEAFRLTKRKEWLDRSNWLVQLLSHTAKENDSGDLYWSSNNQEHSTADFLTGNSGIIHFLMRSLAPDQIGYRLLTS